jgi:hypothetical protein
VYRARLKPACWICHICTLLLNDITAGKRDAEGLLKISSCHRAAVVHPKSLCLLYAQCRNLYAILMRRTITFCSLRTPSGGCMDVVFVVAAAAMAVAMVGLVIFCDKLGARK